MFLGICGSEMDAVWNIVKMIILAIRIIIPVVLVVIGTVAFGKAIIAEDDKEIKSAVTKLVKKVILAVIIFVLPAIIKAIFSTLLSGSDTTGGNSESWVDCIDKVL